MGSYLAKYSFQTSCPLRDPSDHWKDLAGLVGSEYREPEPEPQTEPDPCPITETNGQSLRHAGIMRQLQRRQITAFNFLSADDILQLFADDG